MFSLFLIKVCNVLWTSIGRRRNGVRRKIHYNRMKFKAIDANLNGDIEWEA